MAFDPLSQDGKSGDEKPLAKRILWMLAFWGMGVAVITAVGFFIRLWIKT